VVGSRQVRLADGTVLTVWVINTSLSTSGSVTASGTQVDWYSPALRLPVHEESHIHGTYSGVVPFTVSSVSDLESATPT
jgi:hypothetical protein